MLIVILGGLAIVRMPTDIFPDIDIPVVSVIWTYAGVSPEEMAEVITVRSERAFTTMVNDIEHMESESLPGLGVIRVFFHPKASVDAAVGQLAAASQSVLKSLPTGITPPNVIRFNASAVPILQLGISSDSLPEQQLYDLGYNFIRTQMANVQGASFPLPYGGKPRQISVDLNPQALYAQGISAAEVTDAINSQSLILPSGTVKIGAQEYTVKLNSAPGLHGILEGERWAHVVFRAESHVHVAGAGAQFQHDGRVARFREREPVRPRARADLKAISKNNGARRLSFCRRQHTLSSSKTAPRNVLSLP